MDYLPSTVFPFLLVYEDDEIAALETVMTLYIWWGHSWFATFPHPPLHIVEAINDLLMRHDKSLYSHITKVLDSDPGLIGWGIISSLFTEIFTKPDWFKVIVSFLSLLLLGIPIHYLLFSGFYICSS